MGSTLYADRRPPHHGRSHSSVPWSFTQSSPTRPDQGRPRHPRRREGHAELPDEHGHRAQRDGIRRTGFDDEISLPGGRRATNEHRRAPDGHRATDVWLLPSTSGRCAYPPRRARQAGRQSAPWRILVQERGVFRASSRRLCARPVRPWKPPQLIITSEPRSVSVPPALMSSDPDASMAICGARIRSTDAASIVVVPLALSITMRLPFEASMVMPPSSMVIAFRRSTPAGGYPLRRRRT